MNNYIIVDKCYTEITPESCKDGDFSDHGFEEQNMQVSFSELVDLMKEHTQASCSPDSGDINTWYGTGYYTSNYGTGTEREETIHFSRLNTPNAAKYWKWVRLAANKK